MLKNIFCMARETGKSEYRGEDAEWPHQIPLKGWVDIGKRVYKEMNVDHVQIVSAGVAFYFFLSIFPTIVVAISIYSLVLDPAQIQEQLSRLTLILPEQAYGMITDILNPVINQDRKEIGWGLLVSILVSIWSAGSMGFSWYVGNFGSYDDLYGSFAAVAILMLWLFLTAFIVLMGAEINSEMEHQTRYDTTSGTQKPMGQRNAWHADHCAVKDSDD